MVVIGTRPEAVKMAPLVRALLDRGVRTTIVHTGQHYDYEMGLRFVHELGYRKLQYSFRLKESQPAAQIAQIMSKLEKPVTLSDPKLILIQGDTNSMLATALAGVNTLPGTNGEMDFYNQYVDGTHWEPPYAPSSKLTYVSFSTHQPTLHSRLSHTVRNVFDFCKRAVDLSYPEIICLA